jgi:hypothetical protein
VGTYELPNVKRPRDLARLETALLSGTGHIAVTAGSHDQARSLVEEALQGVPSYAVLRVRASAEDPLADLDRELGLEAEPEPLDCDRRDALVELVGRARKKAATIFAVVDDGDEAGSEGLERARMALECAPNLIDRLRIIVTGTLRLDSVLNEPAADALASRIGAHVRIDASASRYAQPSLVGRAPVFAAAKLAAAASGASERTAVSRSGRRDAAVVAAPSYGSFSVRSDRALTIGWAASVGPDTPLRDEKARRQSLWKRFWSR